VVGECLKIKTATQRPPLIPHRFPPPENCVEAYIAEQGETIRENTYTEELEQVSCD
jgi:hypothetical protein